MNAVTSPPMSKQQARLTLALIAIWCGDYGGCFAIARHGHFTLLGALVIAIPLSIAIPFLGLLCCFLGWRALQACYYGPILLSRGLRKLVGAVVHLLWAAASGPDQSAILLDQDEESEQMMESPPGPLSRPSSLAERSF